MLDLFFMLIDFIIDNSPIQILFQKNYTVYTLHRYALQLASVERNEGDEIMAAGGDSAVDGHEDNS